MSVSVAFHGAAGTVTGSCFRVEHPNGAFLVDCGLFQGSKTVRELNYGRFPFDASKIDFVLLTHAHIDHTGLLPKLIKQGFAGPVLTTAGTRDLLTYMLPDSAYIQESEVERLNRRNTRRGRGAVEPIYTRADAEACLGRMQSVDYGRWTAAGAGVQARFWNAGHILGSASVELRVGTREEGQGALHLLFSGDIGPRHKLFLPDPDAPDGVDYIFCESTYGDRVRPQLTPEARRRILGDEVSAALRRGGNLLIPAFAVERTQELLLDLAILADEGAIPAVPVFLDSPLAIRATEVFAAHRDALEDVPDGRDPFGRSNIRFTETAEQSRAIARVQGGAVIIAASGMCDAGRIRHHLKQYLWRPDATVLLTGYQVPGTLGQLLLAGKTSVRIHGEEVAVRAAIRQLDLYSGHADQSQLVEWLQRRLPVRGIFLVHGEEESRTALRDLLGRAGISRRRIHLPKLDDTVELTARHGIRIRPGAHRLSPQSVAGPDWHNEYAQLAIDLQQAVRQAPDDAARRRMLRRVRQALRP